MRYVGSKKRLAKYLLPIILKDRKEGQWYVEPFVGGCNMMENVTGNRIGNDINPYVIALWKALQIGWQPPEEVTEEQYRFVKDNKEAFQPEYVCFVGFSCSFGGKWFGGYARSNTNNGIPRNMVQEQKRALLKQVPKIRDITFINFDYEQMIIPNNSIIYCDPPYASTLGYGIQFDHIRFWHWIREISKTNRVFVSEYEAPEDFDCVLEVNQKLLIDSDTSHRTTRVEKLFTFHNQ